MDAVVGPGIHAACFDEAIAALLVASGLPVADLAAGAPVELFALGDVEGVAGVVGVEVLGRQGLLRSLAVAERARGKGLGRRLVGHLEGWASRQGLGELQLLTATASDFFARGGFERIARDAASTVVERSKQFASLCPASAALMRKRLPTAPAPLALAWELVPSLAGLQFGLGASTLLHHLGLEAAPRDLDLVCTIDDFARIVERLEARLERLPQPAHPRYRSAGFAQFVSGEGVQVEVMAGIEVAGLGETLRWRFEPQRIHWSGGLPWMDPRDWLVLYRLFDRPARVAQIEAFLRDARSADAMAREAPGLRVVAWTPSHRGWFESLNREWLERWFTVEDKDRHYFSDPEGTILAPGGAIFMALDAGEPVGTAAAIRHDDTAFELAKMAVTPRAQGRGVGGLLVEAVLRFAATQGARRVVLVSDTKLPAAIRLYERHGFRHAPSPGPTGYARGDVFMVHDREA
jgi:N-acetylglutamate synthase-like GNAT family acetyltransferase